MSSWKGVVLLNPFGPRPETGGLLLRDLSTNGVGLRSGRKDTMTKAIGRWGFLGFQIAQDLVGKIPSESWGN